MARREIGEINAGSMADIAFLLLIFFLVTTTMDFDQGIAKVLPQKPDEKMENTIILKRNVLEIQANFNDELLVNGEPMNVEDLKDKTIEFMQNEKDDASLPAMLEINATTCKNKMDTLKMLMRENPTSDRLEIWKSDLEDWEQKQAAFELYGPYKIIPKLSVISVQTDNGTSYSFYMKIQDALKGAINKLRNDVSKKLYNVKFTDLKETEPADIEKIRIIRAIIPERIAEMEPRNIQEF